MHEDARSKSLTVHHLAAPIGNAQIRELCSRRKGWGKGLPSLIRYKRRQYNNGFVPLAPRPPLAYFHFSRFTLHFSLSSIVPSPIVPSPHRPIAYRPPRLSIVCAKEAHAQVDTQIFHSSFFTLHLIFCKLHLQKISRGHQNLHHQKFQYTVVLSYTLFLVLMCHHSAIYIFCIPNSP